MDIDKVFVASILAEGPEALAKAIAKGAGAGRLVGEGKDAFVFMQEYHQKYGKLPQVDLVAGKTRIDLAVELEPVDFCIDEINKRHLFLKMQEGLQGVLSHQEKRDPGTAYAEMEKLLHDLKTDQVGISAVESLFKQGPEVKEFYQRIKSGQRGILTPWEAINESTLGFWPEDLILFVARVGVGKTWSAVLLALHAWLTPRPETGERSRVLFITTEVSRMRIGMRFYAAMERLPYGNLTHGRLDAFSEDRFYKAIDRLYEAEGLYIIGGDFDFQLDSISAAIESAKPDLVVLDGVYLLRVAGATRTERMANAFDEVKRLAKRKRVPIVITTQFNREVKKDLAKTVQVESIALSDVGAWNADLIFGLIQTDDMKIEKRMIFKPLKVREGEGKEVTVNWNFDRMDFSELVGDGGGGGDADELGAAKPSADADGFTRNDTDDLPF